MTDREQYLLELAAKAAGIAYFGWNSSGTDLCIDPVEYLTWNPLTSDGDALRLALKCGISVLPFSYCISTQWPLDGLPEELIGVASPYEDISLGQDHLAAARLAIVRAAAELGKFTQ